MKTIAMKWMALVMAAVAATFVVSCESEDTDEDISATVFSLDRDLASYSGQDSYTWSTTKTSARVDMRIRDFHAGDSTIQVYDGAGRLIFTRTYLTRDNTFYTGDNEFTDVGTTEVGVAGDWVIRLSYDDFTGNQKLTLD